MRKSSPCFKITLRISIEEFNGPAFQTNLAILLGIPPERIVVSWMHSFGVGWLPKSYPLTRKHISHLLGIPGKSILLKHAGWEKDMLVPRRVDVDVELDVSFCLAGAK